ncbi:Palmitoyltransferase [Nowakowskiella sp. JEL0078]|nr:Palmitoyltransferase [Nowakowskiella sp. JEL0078]
MDLLKSQHSSNHEFIDWSTGKFNSSYYYTPPPSTTEVVFTILNVLILFLLTLTVGILCLWQVWYMSMNVTTIEKQENDHIENMIKRGQVSKDYMFPYDLGLNLNFHAVLGSHPSIVYIAGWLWPWKPPGDGINFPVSDLLAKSGKVVVWPPAEYYVHRPPRYIDESSDDDEQFENHVAEGDYSGNESESIVYPSRNIRRGSEGYLVREWTPEEREQMVKHAEHVAKMNDGNSSYGPSEDEDDELLGLRKRKFDAENVMNASKLVKSEDPNLLVEGGKKK